MSYFVKNFLMFDFPLTTWQNKTSEISAKYSTSGTPVWSQFRFPIIITFAEWGNPNSFPRKSQLP